MNQLIKVLLIVLMLGAIVSSTMLINIIAANNVAESGLVGGSVGHAMVIPRENIQKNTSIPSSVKCSEFNPTFKEVLYWFIGNVWALILSIIANGVTVSRNRE